MLVKAGCFSGACHGAGSGQSGFKLSLLGYDPESDFEAIVRQFRGRRINLVRPEESLLLRKATGRIAHGGGVRFGEESATYKTVLDWLSGGAPLESSARRRMRSIRIEPVAARVFAPGGKIHLKVLAQFSDGSLDDVTPYALYSSNDDAIARVNDHGVAVVLKAGETAVTARFMGKFATARLAMPFAGDPGLVNRLSASASNFIDRRINRNLRHLRIPASPRCSDSEFLRRAYLDVIGSLPTVEESRAFLASKAPGKRAQLVDELLGRTEFADYWTIWLLDLFRSNSRHIGEKNFAHFANWIKDQLRADYSLAGMVRDLLTSTGDSAAAPGVNFLRQTDNPKLIAELATEALMGSRSRCAQCHDHPFDSWTQTQYHQFVSFFVRVNRTENGIRLADHGEVMHPKTGKAVMPGFPDETGWNGAAGDRREALAKWLVAPDTPYFARSFANRIWARLMGRGLIEPLDDLSVSNAPTNPELLTDLAEYFRRDFSLRSLARQIINSDAYQRSGKPNGVNAADDRFYSRAYAAPLGSYVLADAISQVTGVADFYGKLPLGVRAMEVTDSQIESYLLDVCGRCPRDSSCDASNPSAGGVRQMLHFLNGPAVNARIAANDSRLSRLRKGNAAPRNIVEEFYFAALSRPPSPAERDYWLTQIGGSASPEDTMEDLIWSLLNSRAFVFNR
jgi:hypothetical protein